MKLYAEHERDRVTCVPNREEVAARRGYFLIYLFVFVDADVTSLDMTSGQPNKIHAEVNKCTHKAYMLEQRSVLCRVLGLHLLICCLRTVGFLSIAIRFN